MNEYSRITSTLRRKGRWLVPLTLLLAAGGSIALWPAATVMSAVKQAIADPRSIFAERSPGQRDPGALTQTKEAYPILNDAAGMPAPPADMLMEPSPLPTDVDEPKAFAAIVPPDEAGAPVSGAGLPGSPLGSPVVIIPSAGAPGDGPGSPTLPDLPILGVPPPPPVITFPVPPPDGPPVTDGPGPPVSPVPEPASWVTMIVGFLTIGGLLRRRAGAGTASDRRSGIA